MSAKPSKTRSFAGGAVLGLGIVLVVVGALILWAPHPKPVPPVPSCPIIGSARWVDLAGVRTWCDGAGSPPVKPPSRVFREYEACVIAKPSALDCDQYLGGHP